MARGPVRGRADASPEYPSEPIDGVVDEPLHIRVKVTRTASNDLEFDFAGSSPPCRGPMNSVIATTISSVYLAVRHIFPDTPLNAGAFAPLSITGTTEAYLPPGHIMKPSARAVSTSDYEPWNPA